MDRFVSRFTPSLTPPETLEAMFVQRHDLADTLVERIRESVLTDAKHHALLVGPRGIGKTHLVSLVYHRVKAFENLRDSLLIAWLHEEEWGIASFLDLLLRILRALYREYADTDLEADVEALYSLEAADEAQRKAEVMLEEYVGDRTLLVLVENLDDVFDGLSMEGQQQFRAYLQQYQFTTVLATSQSLFKGVSDRSFPFYGFFRPHSLKPFSLDEAAALLANIARHEEKNDLAEYILTPEGRARIRAVHHLAGGNPRVYVILSQFLTRESLDALVEPFMLMLDDLTPYYQSRMASLSAQQRKIVEVLIEYRAALPVKQIASRCFITAQTTSGQLRTLRDLGYVQSVQAGRESYYELREPLMRFSLEMKKHRGGPIQLFIDFLRIWYTRPELELQLETLRTEASVDREYLLHALALTGDASDDPRIAACLADFEKHCDAGEYDQAQRAADELVVIRGESSDWHKKSSCLSFAEKYQVALEVADRAINELGGNALLLMAKATALVGLGRVDEIAKLLDKAYFSAEGDPLMLLCRGALQRVTGMHEKAVESFQAAYELDPMAAMTALHASSLVELGRNEAALALLDGRESEGYEIDERLADEAARARATALMRTGRYAEALTILDGSLLRKDEDTKLQGARAVAAVLTGDYKRGKALLEKEWSGTIPLSMAFIGGVAVFGQWSDAVEALAGEGLVFDAMQKLGEMPRIGVWSILLIATLASPIDVLPLRVRTLAEQSVEYGDEALVVAALSMTPSLGAPIEKLREWCSAWGTIAAKRPAFTPAARVLDAALAYRETNDLSVLLRLPVEERKVLQQALDLEETDV